MCFFLWLFQSVQISLTFPWLENAFPFFQVFQSEWKPWRIVTVQGPVPDPGWNFLPSVHWDPEQPMHRAGTCLMWLYSYFLECRRRDRSLLVVYVLPLNYLSEWSPMEQRAPAQWFVTRPVSLRSLKTGTTQIPFLLVLYLFIALVCSTTVSLVYMSVHYRVARNTFVCRALHALGRAAPTLGAPQSLGWAAPRFCWSSKVRRVHWAAA